MQVWTDAQDAQLRELWVQPSRSVSAAEIAKIVGAASKNAVISRAHRIDLPPRDYHNTKTPSERRERRYRRAAFRAAKPRLRPAAQVKPRPVVPNEPQGPGISFDMLKSPHCRYAVNEDHPFLFCGEVKKEGSSYCEFHADLCRDKSR